MDCCCCLKVAPGTLRNPFLRFKPYYLPICVSALLDEARGVAPIPSRRCACSIRSTVLSRFHPLAANVPFPVIFPISLWFRLRFAAHHSLPDHSGPRTDASTTTAGLSFFRSSCCYCIGCCGLGAQKKTENPSSNGWGHRSSVPGHRWLL